MKRNAERVLLNKQCVCVYKHKDVITRFILKTLKFLSSFNFLTGIPLKGRHI